MESMRAGYFRDVFPLFISLEDILRNRRSLFIDPPVFFDAPWVSYRLFCAKTTSYNKM
jgi:hypothetical protein